MFNKKFLHIFVILFVFFLNLPVFSLETSKTEGLKTSSKGEHAEERAVIGMGNDCWNFGQSKNYDDGLSFALNTYYQRGPLKVGIDLNAYTNRGYKESKLSEFVHGRYDMLLLNVAYQFRSSPEKRVFFSLTPEVGAGLVGKFGMNGAQNAVHDMLDLYRVELPYDYESPEFYPILNMTAGFGGTIAKIGRNRINIEAFFRSQNVFFYEYLQDYKAELSLKRDGNPYKTVFVFAGFNSVHSFTDNFTHRLYVEDIKGFKYGFGISSGLVNIDYAKYTGNGFGYTNVMIDVMSLFKERTFETEDFSFEVGRARILEKNFECNRVLFPLKNGFSAGVKLQASAGSPSRGTRENDITTIRFKRNYSFTTLDVRYTLGLFKNNFAELYAEGGIGFSSLSYEFLYNMNPDAEVQKSEKHTDILFALNIEAGLLFLPDAFLRSEGSAYKVLLFGGCNIIPDKATVTDIIRTDEDKDESYSFSGFAPYFGYGVHISFDM